jgi:hypothetical protein
MSIPDEGRDMSSRKYTLELTLTEAIYVRQALALMHDDLAHAANKVPGADRTCRIYPYVTLDADKMYIRDRNDMISIVRNIYDRM